MNESDALHVPSGRACRVVRISQRHGQLGAWVSYADEPTVMCEWVPLEELLITW